MFWFQKVSCNKIFLQIISEKSKSLWGSNKFLKGELNTPCSCLIILLVRRKESYERIKKNFKILIWQNKKKKKKKNKTKVDIKLITTKIQTLVTNWSMNIINKLIQRVFMISYCIWIFEILWNLSTCPWEKLKRGFPNLTIWKNYVALPTWGHES